MPYCARFRQLYWKHNQPRKIVQPPAVRLRLGSLLKVSAVLACQRVPDNRESGLPFFILDKRESGLPPRTRHAV
jgi:hypothetical protein